MSITKFITLAALAANAVAALASPRSETFISQWQFSRDSVQWQPVTIPHDWAISGPFDKKWDLQVVAIEQNGEKQASEHSGRSGALPWIGRGFYRTTITVPAGTAHAQLQFDGAMASPHVYVNGHLAGYWEYGYNAFNVDITPYLHPDGSPDTLAVSLENLEESNRWYPGAGLYRPVKLVLTGPAALLTWGAQVQTLSIGGDSAVIDVRHQLRDATQAGCSLQVSIADAQGRTVATATTPPDGMGQFHTRLTVRHPALWSPESPALYDLRFSLRQQGREADCERMKLGIRTVEVDSVRGFVLNGVPRKLKGVCLHHDLGPLGAAVNKAAMVRQLRLMKQMGADAIRTSHNMPSELQMQLCDSMGLMVMAESFDAWHDAKVRNGYNRLYDQWWRRDLTHLVLHHRNHPCVVMWSVGNEIPEQWKPQGAQRYKQMIELCHQLGPTRLVTCGMDQPDGVLWSGFAMVADVPGFNYRVNRYDDAIKRLPQGFLLGSETASTVSTRGHYVFPDTCATGKAWPDGQCSGYDVEYCWWSNLPDDDWRMQDDRPWTIGEFVWTGFDYLGEPTPYDAYWPSRSSYFGIVDLAGLPKDRYYLYRSHWNTRQPTLHLLPHWTWPGREGQVTPVYCYTSWPSAELFVNGKSQGRLTKDTTTRLDRYRLRWRNVRYEPGELCVVAYDSTGHAVAQQTVRTAERPARLLLQPDRDTLQAGGDDLSFVTVSLVDKHGTLCPDADDQLEFSVTGAGTYRAACNGDATSLEPFTQPQMRLFHGQLVVVVQAGKDAGVATLNVRDRRTGLRQSVKLRVQ